MISMDTVSPAGKLDIQQCVPIKTIDVQEFKEAAKRLHDNVDFWVQGWPAESSEDPEMLKQWKQRFENTYEILKYANHFSSRHNAKFLSYEINNRPIGLIVMATGKEENSPAELLFIVTHPGSEKAAGPLIEAAVNMAQGWNKSGRITLNAANENAAQAYRHMGFTKVDRIVTFGPMTLDPSKSAKWCSVDNSWRMQDNVGRTYLCDAASDCESIASAGSPVQMTSEKEALGCSNSDGGSDTTNAMPPTEEGASNTLDDGMSLADQDAMFKDLFG